MNYTEQSSGKQARRIGFLRAKPVYALVIVAGLVILGIYWKSLPDYPKVYFFSQQEQSANTLKPVKVDGKWGYADRAGKIVIAPVYDEVSMSPFPMGERPVSVKANGKYGYINRKGEAVIPLRFDEVGPLGYYGMVRVRIGNKWGWINERGKEITPLRFDEAGEFFKRQTNWNWNRPSRWEELYWLLNIHPATFDHHTLAKVMVDGKWGYINIRGKEIIPPRYDEVYDDRKRHVTGDDVLALVREGDKWSWIDFDGKDITPSYLAKIQVKALQAVRMGNKWGYVWNIDREKNSVIAIAPRFDRAQNFQENDQAIALLEGKWVFIDTRGKIPEHSPDATDDRPRTYPFSQNGKWGYCEQKNPRPCQTVVLFPRFDVADDFPDGVKRARVMLGGKWGYVNPGGKEVIPLQFEAAQAFDSTGLAKVRRDGKWGYIDTSGKIIIPLHFDVIDDSTREILKVAQNGKWGYLDLKGQEIFAPRFDFAGDFDRGLARVEQDQKWGYVNTEGQEIIPLRFDAIGDFDANRLAKTQQNGKWGYVDSKGREVIAPRFDEVGFSDTANGQEKVALKGKWGLIDVQGQELLPLRFDEILDGPHVADGILALVREGTKWRWIDAKGKETVPAYVVHADFRKLAPLQFTLLHSPKYGYVDDRGVLVVTPRFDEARGFAENGRAPVRLDDKWGLIDAKGKPVIPPRFDAIADFNAHGLAKVGIGSHCVMEEDVWQSKPARDCQWGWIDAGGKEIIPVHFIRAGEFDDRGLVVVRYDEEWGMVNTQGEEIVPVRFMELHTGETVGEDIAALVREDDTWTWYDRKGKTLIPDYVRRANAGELQPWCHNWHGRARCGYTDPKDRIVIPPRFDEAGPFDEKGRAKVKWRGQWLWIDARGETIAE